jgi:membrane fusion protein (multidrug efflux system)
MQVQVTRRCRGLGGVIVAALLVLTGPGCGGEAGANPSGKSDGKKGGGDGKKGPTAEPLAVAVVHLEPAAIERQYRTAGTLRALRTADLVALQPGVVLELRAEEGDQVKAGAVLVRLDGRSFKLQANRDAIAARNAAQELRRIEQLEGLLSREELDKQRYTVESAVASASVSRHQANLTTVVAPFDGTITKRAIDVGNLATTATALFTIADLSVLDVDLFVPEREASTVHAGAPATLVLQDGTKFAGTVERRAPVVDPLTGTVKFTVRAKEFPPAAVPGAFVRAELLVDRREAAPSVPRTAVFELEGVPHVYVVEEGRARRRAVEPGLVGETRMELIGGVEASAQIVADAGAGITEGMPVKVLAPGAGPKDSEAGPKDSEAGPKGSEAAGGEAGPKGSEAAGSKDGEAGPKDSKAGPKDSKGGGPRGGT